MQNTTNAFQDGITTDLHPLNMPETALTSALNATIFTGNGNEGLLQNDMGNTLIKDSITGSVMALNDGFIPLGMKEYGGILYIASYNPESKEGELGSIPSPIIRYTINGFNSDSNRSDILISDLGEAEDTEKKSFIYTNSSSNEEITPRLNTNTLLILNDYIFHCGDKFVVQLNLNLQEDPSVTTRHQTNTNSSISIDYPQITKYIIDQQTDTYETLKGWFRIELYAVLENGSEIQLTDLEDPQEYYHSESNTPTKSEYWFLKGDCDFDPVTTRTANMYRTYPNIPAGRLAIKVVPEYPSQLEYLYNFSYDSNLPQVYAYQNDEDEENSEIHRYVIVPGYTFSADCPIMPDMIEVICNNGELPIYTGENNDLGIPENCILVKSSLDSNEVVTGIDTALVTETVPYSNRDEKYAKPKLAYKSYDSKTNTYIISKYLQPESNRCSYNTNPIKNYSLQDHNGLFWVEIPNWNTELEFTLKLYTKGFSGYIENGVQKNTYVLYATQTFPKFNPAEAELKNKSSLLDGDLVSQYYKFGHDNYETFDLPLFEHSEQKCFLYGDEGNGNILYDYDQDLEKYVPFTKNRSNSPVLQDDAKNVVKQIYPQLVREYNSSNRDKEDGTRFIWNQIPVGYRNMPSKEFFTEIKKLGTWGKEHYANNVDWEWFVESTITPSIKIQSESGGDEQIRECLLPIKRNTKLATENTDIYQYCNDILQAAQEQREYFKTAADDNGFTIDLLKKYCLYKTNLEISHASKINWSNFTAANPRPGWDEPNLGARMSNGGEQYFTREGGFSLCRNELSGTQIIKSKTKEDRQGIENGLYLDSFNDDIESFETKHNRVVSSNAYDNLTNDLITESPQLYPAFYWYCPTVDSNRGIIISKTNSYAGQYANFMLDESNQYNVSSMGKRSIHDSYYAHLVLGFRPFDPKYWDTSKKKNNNIYNTTDKLQTSGLDTKITYPHVYQKNNPNTGALTTKTHNFAWYVSGFITEAMKKCPGYVPADKNSYNVLNISVLNEKYATDYLYNQSTELIVQNFGYGLAMPKIPLTYTCVVGDAQSYNIWHNENIFSTPQFNVTIKHMWFGQENTINVSSEESYCYIDKKYLLLNANNNTGGLAKYKIAPNKKNLPIQLNITVTPNNNYSNATKKTKSVQAYPFTRSMYDLHGNWKGTPLGWAGTVDRTFSEYSRQWELLNRDNCAVIVSPQLFVQKDDEITRFYKSDYQVKPILSLQSSPDVGIWQDSKGQVMWKESNIEFDNLLKLEDKDTLQAKKPSELGYTNTFQDEAQYWAASDFKATSDFKSEGKVFVTTEALESGWYVFCINYNCDSEASFSVLLGKDRNFSTQVSDKFYKGYRFLPVHISENYKYIKLIASGNTSNSYIRNFGLYKINVPQVEPTESISPNTDLFNAIKELEKNIKLGETKFIEYNDNEYNQQLYRSLIFPCTLCFKEVVYKEIDAFTSLGALAKSSSSGSSSIKQYSAKSSSAKSSTNYWQTAMNNKNDIINDLGLGPNSKMTEYKFQNTGCLGQEYNGFQELPDEAYKECVIAYGLEEDSITFKTYWLNPRFNNQQNIENLVKADSIVVRELNPIENN